MTQHQTIRHPSGSTEPLLSVRDLRVTFQRHGEKAFHAVDGEWRTTLPRRRT